MKKVVGYVRRRLAQGPSHDVEHSDWRIHYELVATTR
jgi:hypothetical protein